MKIRPHLHKLFWLLPFASYSIEANAWGLVTHLYFAQSLLWAMPLLDPRLQRAIKRFPELVMAGACLPDLAIVSPAFRHTHHWENAHHLLLSADSDEETAIAIGYASHLYVDVIAHNHFVPAHEAMWLENTMLTHIAVEWAMDAHLAQHMEMCRQMMGQGGMMGGGMGPGMMGPGMMGGDPKQQVEMMAMRGEMMKAMGDIMMKYAQRMQSTK